MTTATKPLRKWTTEELDALCAELREWLAAHDGEPHVTERYTIILQFISDLSERTPEWYAWEGIDGFLARVQHMKEEIEHDNGN